MAKLEIDVKAGYPGLGREEGVFEVPAQSVTDVYAINKGLRIDGEGDVNYRNTWNVTHLPTGLAMVRGLPSSKAAKAVAKILEAEGYDVLTTEDPNELAREAAGMGLAALKLWIREQEERSRSPETFLRKLAQRGGTRLPRAAKRSTAPERKETKKKPGKKKPERPQAYVDLLEMARRRR